MRLISSPGLLVFLIAALQPIPGMAAKNIRIETGAIVCGNTIVEAHTTYLDLPDYDTQVLDQRLIASNIRTNQRVQLMVDGRYVTKSFTGKRRVLDAAVESWACVVSKHGQHYIALMYYCTAGEEKGICAPGKVEWERILRDDGTAVDKSPRHWTVTRADADLYKSLGLEDITREGAATQLKGIDEP